MRMSYANDRLILNYCYDNSVSLNISQNLNIISMAEKSNKFVISFYNNEQVSWLSSLWKVDM